jgi:hypothetical protein
MDRVKARPELIGKGRYNGNHDGRQRAMTKLSLDVMTSFSSAKIENEVTRLR